MQIFFLGTGGSEGLPCPHCFCDHCREARKYPLFRRVPSAVLVLNARGEALLVDAGTDVAEVCDGLNLQGVLLTHWHADHYAGLFRLGWSPHPLPLVSPEPGRGRKLLPKGLKERRGAPLKALELGSFRIFPLSLKHTVPTWGYLVEDEEGHSVAFLWDTKGLPLETEAFLRRYRPHLAVVDATYPPEIQAENHNNLREAAEIGLSLAHEVLLTHISHQNHSPFFLEEYLGRAFPQSPVALAYDGLKHSLAYPLSLSLKEAEGSSLSGIP
ncbi:MBL fold metallo-hydrolase [Thermosulfurimonas marina]|uniref:MBL fold metallo-hydrolase n=1 Tax=Thermosulfurimonas marina TaxID=2047767 RepID=A0A6H1WS55_9BACT|nr:MBL fold metallo-hydrolase [Thermosulfurimonas marina]QJA06000.1 MBL fold metallo-hydrolase [Thermosulfurimonas marina]